MTAPLADLLKLTLQDPRRGARAVLSLGLPLPVATAGLLLVAVASTLVSHLGFLLLPVIDDPVALFLTASPFRTALLQWLLLAGSALLIYRVGKARGGTGTLPDALLLVVWLQVPMVGVQIIQLVVLLVIPPLAGLISIAGLGLFLWLLASFIAELHGFASRWAVLAGVMITSFAAAFVLVVILALLIGPEALSNV
jgi:hypothetical protein